MKEYRIGVLDKRRGGYIHIYKETTKDIFTALVYMDHANVDIANDPCIENKRMYEAVILDEDMYEVHGTYEGIDMTGTPFIVMY